MDPEQTDTDVVSLVSWTQDLEEVLSWLLGAEDHLVAINSLGQKNLETVKTRFYNHEDFMLELKTHQSTVGEVSMSLEVFLRINVNLYQVLTAGRHLMTGQSTHDQKKDIKLQMKVLNEK